MSLWSKVSRLLPFKRNRPIGHDLQGNAYYEVPNPYGRAKRMVEYAEKRSIDYRKGTAQLPVQWTAWLSWTRDTPPSLAELRADADRVARLQPLIAKIEERERAERIQQGYLLPDGSELPRTDGERVFLPLGSTPRKSAGAVAPPAAVPPYPLDAEVDALVEPTPQVQPPPPPSPQGQPQSHAYPQSHAQDPPQPDSDFIAPPRAKVDPSAANSADELRRLAEEDTRRRLAESGVSQDSGPCEGVTSAGRSLKPRRRGAANT